MTISDEERTAIVEHRLRRATGLLIHNGHSPHTHNDAFSLLGKYFVTNGIINKEQNKLYRNLFDLRQDGDYSDWILIDEEDVAPLSTLPDNLSKHSKN
jgi:uncharacterized protein (UPF0332 family)